MRSIVRSCLFAMCGLPGLAAAVQWREGFEAGAPGWTIEGATWAFGKPTAPNGPAAYAGLSVAGTGLAGNYGRTHAARLITPPFVVPAASASPRFTYHSWYEIGANDHAQLQLRVAGGDWRDVAPQRLTESGGSWARHSVDLRAYAGQSVQFAFHFVALSENRRGDLALGWFIDEAALETGPMTLAAREGFENGFGDWSVEGGVWQIGTPAAAAGPAPFSGAAAAGTSLAEGYGTNHDARLITPEFIVPAAAQGPRFSFHYWYQLGVRDYGQLQLRVVGGEWQDVAGGRLTGAGESWARRSVDLRAYAGQTVQVAFRLVAVFENRRGDVRLGWFIDEAGLETGPMPVAPSEGFEQGFGQWSVEGGVWQVGVPKAPGGPTAFAGSAVAGTTLKDNYGTTHDARLLTPEFTVPPALAAPRFTFHYWYALGGGDHGQLQIRTVGGGWQDVTGERLTSTGGAWARRSVDLRAFAGQTVQLAFRLVTTFNNYRGDAAPGWFIDEARLETGPMAFALPEGFENGFGQWSVEGGVWQIGAPTARNGPTAHAGAHVAGTILAGNYPAGADARLVSPEFIVPPGLRAPQLMFQHWRSWPNRDGGRIEISAAGGAWTPLGDVVTGSETAWKPAALDLAGYAGQPVRVAFHFTSDRFGTGAGWYLDEVQIGMVDPTTLALGTPADGILPASGARMYYAIDVPPGGHLSVTLDDLDDRGANEIYVRRGAIPTAGDYDYRSRTAGADTSLFAPNAGAGPWFILLIGSGVPTGGNAYQIRADHSQGIALTSVTPTRAGNGVPAVLDLGGAGFDGTARIELRAGAMVAATGNATVISPGKLRADFALSGVAPGNYQLTVVQGTNSAALPFEITPGGKSHFEANLVAPRAVGRHALGTLYVDYVNHGDVAMPAPLVLVRCNHRALLTLNPALGSRGLYAAIKPSGFDDTVQILAGGATPGILQPGERQRVPVMFAGLLKPWNFKETNVRFDLAILESTETMPIRWQEIKASPRPPGVDTDAWEAVWENRIAQIGSTWGDYVKALGRDALFLGELGINTRDVTGLEQFALAQAEGLTATPSLASSVDVAVPVPGPGLGFSRYFPSRLSGRFRTGPLGRGWSHNWEFSLRREADGAILVLGPGGTVREFVPHARGGFLSLPGDHGVLTLRRDGHYQLREKDGITIVFRPDSRLDYVEDAHGNRVTAAYAGALLESLTHSSGPALRLAYSAGLIQTVTDPTGRVTRYEYDGGRHLIAVSADGAPAATYTYASGQGPRREHALTSLTYAGRPTRTFAYDERGRLSSDQLGGSTAPIRYDYGPTGTVTMSDAASRRSTRFFNHQGLLAKVIGPLGGVAQATFDPAGNATSLRRPDGGTINVTYDRAGNPVRVVDALGAAVSLKYGANARVGAITDARGQTSSFTYDPAGSPLASVLPDGSRESRTFTAQGLMTSLRNRRGQTIKLTHDAAGRVIRRELPEGRTFDFTYDARGQLTHATDSAAGATTFVRDARGQVSAITYPDGRGLSYAYDAAGRRTRRTTLDGDTLNYYYDAGGRLERLEDGSSRRLVKYTYDATGALAREDKGNGTWTIYERDGEGRGAHVVNHGTDGAVLSRFDYTYGLNGLRTSMRTLAGDTTFTHDGNGRLTGATYPNGRTASYVYDAAGNRVEVIEDGTTRKYTTNALNQYTRVGPVTFTYDADGNLTSRTDSSGTSTYTYDSESRLIRVVTPAEGTWDFSYDVFGLRNSVTHRGTTTRTLNDPFGAGTVAAEYDGTGLVARYALGHGLAARIAATGEASYYNFDLIGNTREITGPNGAVTRAYDYDVFGKVVAESGTLPNPFAFSGRYGVVRDATGLDYMRARFYAPELGRFHGRDALWLAGPTLNAYTYVNNAPADFINPAGLWSVSVSLPADLGSGTVGWDPKTHEIFWGGGGGLGMSLGLLSDKNGIHGIVLEPFGGISFDLNATNFGPSTTLTYGFGTGKSITHSLDEHGREIRSEEDFYGFGFSTTGQLILSLMHWDPTQSPWFNIQNYFWRQLPIWLREGDFRTGWRSFIAAVKDPNELIGPAGYGPGNHRRGEGPFAYRLNFENDRTATAPVHVVEISNPIPAQLDLATLELTSVGFGDLVIPIPAGSQRFEHTQTVTFQDTTFEVLIEATLDPATRELRTTFSSLMPETGLPPPVDIGFLPPEDDTGRGIGHVGYVVRPLAALPTGAEIRNIGFVTFDRLAGGPTFRTDLLDPHDPNSAPSPARQALVTIDADGPTSRVAALPAESRADAFNVSWSGTDPGAGIAAYDVYVQTDGGAWTAWRKGSTEKAESWRGQYGHRYGFFSVATDGVGFSETAPAPGTPAQAQTLTIRPLLHNPWLWGALAALLALIGAGLRRRHSARTGIAP